MSFETSHICSLRCDSISHLPKIFPDASYDEKCSREFKKWLLVSNEHPHVFIYLKSRAAIEKESKRQVEKYSGFLIHPLSRFRKYWNIFVFIMMLLNEMLTAFIVGLFHHLEESTSILIHTMLISAKIILLFEVCLQFRTGYIVNETFEIVLNTKKIYQNYLKSHFLPDLFCCLPHTYFVVYLYDQNSITIDGTFLLIVIFLFLFSVYRFNRIMFYFSTIPTMLKMSERTTILLTIAVRSFYCWHWLSCFRLLFPLFHDKNPIAENELQLTNVRRSDSKFSLPKRLEHDLDYEKIEDLIIGQLGSIFANETVINHYTKTMMVTLRIMLLSGYIYEEVASTTFTMLMTDFIMFAGWIYISYIFIEILNMIISSESSEMKFEMICHEIKAFCRSKTLSSELTNKIQNYVKLKYQNHYFNEQKIQCSVPIALRKEIMMLSCSHFLSKVTIFKNLPQLLLEQINMCLELEIFFPGDVIISAETVGEYMYFISYGTAQIISSKGVIYDRLFDGDYFGEIELLTRGIKHIATVKAEEVCETYKLSRKDFRKVIEPHPEVLRNFEQIALQRLKNNSRQQQQRKVSFEL